MRFEVENVIRANPKNRDELITTVVLTAMVLITMIIIAYKTQPWIIIVPYELGKRR